jgi:hypothetical protein
MTTIGLVSIEWNVIVHYDPKCLASFKYDFNYTYVSF